MANVLTFTELLKTKPATNPLWVVTPTNFIIEESTFTHSGKLDPWGDVCHASRWVYERDEEGQIFAARTCYQVDAAAVELVIIND